ncbi:MAG: four-carbon acid sugar kinase family protein [Clostridia bacterium]|nr:four-carbon acid sugar kinase family protein [Clostridia bacterium]
MPELFIAADDFTGALDTGVKLARQGVSVRVTDGAEAMECRETVLVSNLETRHVSRDHAFHITLDACVRALKAGASCIYIKTDSGLRGNIGAALEAAARAVGGRVVFAPAYPALNRISVNGIHMIGDLPVSQSVFGKDPLNPVKHDSIYEILAEQTDLRVFSGRDGAPCEKEYIELRELNTDGEMLAYALETRRSAAQAKAYAGCAGFAEVLGELLSLTVNRRHAAKIRLPLAVISASLSQINFEQMRFGEALGLKSCALRDVFASEPDYAKIVAETLASSKGALIESAKSRTEAEELSEKGEKEGLDAAARALIISKNMGGAASALVQAGFKGTLCLFGGDVLKRALQSLSCRALVPIDEVEPGVVVSRAITDRGEITVVSKSGSFGSPEVIQKLIDYAEVNK